MNRWTLAGNLLQALIGEAERNPVTSLPESDRRKRTKIESPLPGFTFEAQTSWLSNNSIMIQFEAERAYCFGLFYRSIYSILEVSPDGTTEKNPIYTRFESFAARKTRRERLESNT